MPIIVFSQFAGTSLWFAGNAVLPELQAHLALANNGLVGLVTSAVQLGFILGTLGFAIWTIADRYSPRLVFLVCAVLGTAANSAIFLANGIYSLLILRFLTGFFLAGIYPVGMKIAADWYQRGLGKAIGFLVGALALGTGFPHLLRAWSGSVSWQAVIWGVSALAVTGGILLYTLVPDGPHRKPGHRFDPAAFVRIFRSRNFRAAAFGYFGHMWELYTFWAFVPVMLAHYYANHPSGDAGLSLWAFLIIAVGGVSCAVGGLLSLRHGSARVAGTQLFLSGMCCLFSPLLNDLPEAAFLAYLAVWGFFVIGDSPQFSALSAQTAPPELVGTALTIMNSLGFALTIASVQCITWWSNHLNPEWAFVPLAVGPAIGLLALRPLWRWQPRS
ncbi:MAG: MFS transporter [Bacteroidota bacterium]